MLKQNTVPVISQRRNYTTGTLFVSLYNNAKPEHTFSEFTANELNSPDKKSLLIVRIDWVLLSETYSKFINFSQKDVNIFGVQTRHCISACKILQYTSSDTFPKICWETLSMVSLFSKVPDEVSTQMSTPSQVFSC